MHAGTRSPRKCASRNPWFRQLRLVGTVAACVLQEVAETHLAASLGGHRELQCLFIDCSKDVCVCVGQDHPQGLGFLVAENEVALWIL